jgi:hypothetical protein
LHLHNAVAVGIRALIGFFGRLGEQQVAAKADAKLRSEMQVDAEEKLNRVQIEVSISGVHKLRTATGSMAFLDFALFFRRNIKTVAEEFCRRKINISPSPRLFQTRT